MKIEDYEIDDQILLSWVAPHNVLYVVKSGGVTKCSGGGESAVWEDVATFPGTSRALSAWLDSATGRVSVLFSGGGVAVLGPGDWTTLAECQLRGLGDGGGSWVCAVPGPWLRHLTGRLVPAQLHVVATGSELMVVEVASGRQWARRRAAVSRGQFLAQFLGQSVPSVQLSSLCSTVSLLSPSLKCSFLQSSIRDIQTSGDQAIVLTSCGDVWRICNKDLQLSQTRLLANAAGICLLGHVLTVVTRDGAVYTFGDGDGDLQLGDDKQQQRVDGDVTKNIKLQAARLDTLANNSAKVDSKLGQVQAYQYFSSCSPETLGRVWVFSARVDAARAVIVCQLQLRSVNTSLEGRYWSLAVEVEVLADKDGGDGDLVTASASLPAAFSAHSPPLALHIDVSGLGHGAVPVRARALLTFKSHLVRSGNKVKMLPPLQLGSQEFSVLDFMIIKGENVGSKCKKDIKQVLYESLGNDSLDHKRVTFSINKNYLRPSENKFHDIILQSLTREYSLCFLRNEVRLKSEMIKKTSDVSVTLEASKKLVDCLIVTAAKDN